MNKNETIIAVMEAFDEIERLKFENADLKRMNTVVQITESGLAVGKEKPAKPRWFANIYEFGRRAIWEKYAENYYSKAVTAGEDEDGKKHAQTFENWYQQRFDDFPDFMSREDFLVEFDAELHRKYDQKLAEAMKED